MTFTMVARCPRTRALGVVTCTTGIAVGSSVTHAEEGVGAIATQATTNVLHGVNGLGLLKMGFDPEKVLQSTLALDPNPEFRQVLIVDRYGETAAHTGRKNSEWKGHIEGDNYVLGGNSVTGPKVLEAMEETFNESIDEPLQERLLLAIDAGEEAGGCNNPDHTSALRVVGLEDEFKIFSRPVLDLRVDSSDEPTKELRRVYESYKKFVFERRKMPRYIYGFE